MDDDVVKAIVAALRADTTINTGVGGRIYSSQVPADAAFPRCYVRTIRPIKGDEWAEGRQFRCRYPRFTVTFANRTIDSTTAQQDIEQLDARADAVLKDAQIADTEWFYRASDIPIMPQDNDNVQFLTVGGIYAALREYEYYP